MYGSDAMAGVLIFHSAPTLAKGDMRANFSTGYQTNNGHDGDGWHAVGRIYFGGDIVLLMLPLVLSDYESCRAGAG